MTETFRLPNYPTFHCHPQSFDSASTPEAFAAREVELGSGALTCTDHGSMGATRQIYDLARKNKLIPILGCLLPGQPIHTIDGVKKVEDIVVGDWVLTHKGRFRVVTKTMSRPYSGEVIDIFTSRNGSKPLPVTPEHPVLISDAKGSTRWIPAGELNPVREKKHLGIKGHSQYVVLPKPRDVGPSVVYTQKYLPENFKATAEYVQKSVSNQLEGGAKTWDNFGSEITLDQELARFLGLFCAEGSASRSGQCTLTFNIKEVEFVDFCASFLKNRFGVTCNKRDRVDRGTTEMWFCNVPLSWVLIGLVGSGAHNKKVPREILSCRDVQIKQAFLRGLLEGDGKKPSFKRVAESLRMSSIDCIWSARLLAAEHNAFLVPKTSNQKSNISDKEYHSWYIEFQSSAKWRRSIDFGDFISTPLRSVERRHYEGMVYNFTVNEDNSYVSDFVLHNCEGYFRDDNCSIIKSHGIEDPSDYLKYMHITMHAKTQKAFEVLSRKISTARLESGHGSQTKPLWDWKDLEEILAEDVTVGSGCLVGMVSRHLLRDGLDPTERYSIASAYYDRLRGMARPGNFYAELFPHKCDTNWTSGIFLTTETGERNRYWDRKNLKFEKYGEVYAEDLVRVFKTKRWHEGDRLVEVKMNRKWTPIDPVVILNAEKIEGFLKNECAPWCPDGDVQLTANRVVHQLCKKYGDKVALSDDSHFATPGEKIVQDVRLKSMGNWRFASSYHRRSSDETFAHFQSTMGVDEKTFLGWIDNAKEWVDGFKDFKFDSPISLPTKFYPTDTLGHTKKLIDQVGRMDWSNQTYVDRLKKEIQLFHANGTIDLLPYFFMGAEVVELYEKNGSLTGPGRGSCAGTLLTYLLGITHVDPLKYDLSLERFLTLDRIKGGALPDIDQDLQSRDLLINPEDQSKGWLPERFGDHFATIGTSTRLRLKSSVKDVARARLGFVPDDIEFLAKKFLMPPQGIDDHDFIFGYDGAGERIPGSIESDKALQEYIEKYPRDWEVVQRCLGLERSRSKHACLPAGEVIFTVGESCQQTEITQCHQKMIYTGQGATATADLIPKGDREVWEFTLENNKVFRCTPDHRLLTTIGWRQAREVWENQLDLIDPDMTGKEKKMDG